MAGMIRSRHVKGTEKKKILKSKGESCWNEYLSVTGAPSGFFEMINLQARPASFTI